MKRHHVFTLLLVCTIAHTAWAQTPSTLGYQGYLTDSSGKAVADASYSVTFSIYNTLSGGSALWSETQSVTTSGGVFSATLGSSTAITLPFTQQYYLGISISGGNELTPRVQLTPSAYSFIAKNVDDNAITSAKIADGTITSADITDATIASTDLADNVITSAKITDATIATADIAENAITSVKIADGSVSSSDITDGTIATSDLSDNSVTAAKIVDGSITSPDIAGSQVVKSVNNLKDSITLTGGANVTITESGSTITIAASTGAGSVGDDAVTSVKIADGAVATADIADNAITSAKITDGAIASADLATDAVTSAKIADGTIASADVADDAITSAKIVDGAISSADLATGTVATADLADASVTSDKISDGTIASADLSDGSITSAKIVDGTIVTADIADDAITSAKIADGTVTSADISDASIGAGDINSGQVVKSVNSLTDAVTLAAGTNVSISTSGNTLTFSATGSAGVADDAVTSAKITDGAVANADLGADAVTSAKISDGTIVSGDLADGSITSAKIVDGTIVSGDLADGSVTSAKIVDGTIASGDLANNAVTSDKISNGTITTDDLADNSITTAKISDGTITNADLANDAVTSAKITDGTVSAADIADGTVATADIANDAITSDKILNDTIANADISNDAITTNKISDGTIQAADIGSGQVVKSVNSLTDAVTLSAGSNVTITPSGNILTIAASSSAANTLDQAYDQGGAGVGRSITADNGAVDITGAGGLTVNGNVGIGTTSPSGRLHVLESSGPAKMYVQSPSGSGSQIIAKVGDTTSNSHLYFGDTSADNPGQIVYSHSDNSMQFATNTSEVLRLNSSGYMGIGITSPTEKLHVQHSSGSTSIAMGEFEAAIASYTGTSLIASNTLSPASTFNLFSAITDSDGDGGGPNTEFLIRGDGRIGIGTTSPGSNLPSTFNNDSGNASVVELRSANAGDVGLFLTRSDGSTTGLQMWHDYSAGHTYFDNLYDNADGDIRFRTRTAGTAIDAVHIQGDGNVGIGTTTPAQKLDVNGTVQASGNSGTVQLFNADANTAVLNGITDLDLRTGNASILMIKNSGNVGIGTTTPADAKLEVVNTSSGAATTGLMLINSATAASTATRLDFTPNTDTTVPLARIEANRTTSGGATDLLFYTSTNGAAVSEKMRIDTNGNVGIGTTSPGQLLDLTNAGSAGTVYPLRLINNTTANTNTGVGIEFGFQAGSQILSKIESVHQGSSVTDLIFYAQNSTLAEKMRIKGTGNVGIGTTTPAQRLEVSGPGTPGSAGARSANIQAINAGDNLIFGSSNGLNIGTLGSLNGNGAPYLQFLAYHSNTANTGRASGGAGAIPARILSDSGGNDNAFEFQVGNQPGQDNDITWTTAMNIHSNGRVGLGLTTAPSHTLHVADGDVYIGYPGASSTEGYRLALGNYDGYIWRNQTGAYTNAMVMSVNYELNDAGSDVISNSGAHTSAIVQGMSGVIDFRTGAINTAPTVKMTIANDGKVGIGTNSPGEKLDVEASGATVAGFNRTTSDGTVVSIQQDGVEEGTISVSGTTVSYNAFTGSHYAWTNAKIKTRMLVSLTGINKRLHDNHKSEILYGITPSTTANDPKILGAYLQLQEPDRPANTNNPHLVMAVGNGEMWVVDNGKDIEIGDYLISSDTMGHAMRDPETYDISYVIARAAEPVKWDSVTQMIKGQKHSKLSVFFESFAQNHALNRMRTQLEEKLSKQQREIDTLKQQQAQIAALLAKINSSNHQNDNRTALSND